MIKLDKLNIEEADMTDKEYIKAKDLLIIFLKWLDENPLMKGMIYVIGAALLLLMGISIGEAVAGAFNSIRDMLGS
jgi:hypothetical protein